MLLDIINESSVVQFQLNETGKLCVDNDKLNEKGSMYYSTSLLKAIESDYTIYISFRSKLPDEWNVADGIDRQVTAGCNYVFPDSKCAYIFLSPAKWNYMDIAGNIHEASYSEVLFHEIAGHVIPKLDNKNGNAIDIENIIRLQLHLPLRKRDPNHECF